jgi:ABC-type branched-subunit amino acid transport system substrate-binding protein
LNNPTFRDRVAVAFITMSLTIGLVLAVLVVRDVTAPTQYANTGLVAGNSTAAAGTPTDLGAGATPGAALAGTGGGGPSGGSSTTVTNGSNGAGTGNVSNSQSQSGVTGSTIYIGGIFDITGPVDASVERDTVNSYMKKINDAGGINGRTVQMYWCDSKYDPETTHSCALQMIDHNVLAIVGWTAPRGEDSEVSTLVNAGIPIIGGLGTPNEYKYSLSYPVTAAFTRLGTAIGYRGAAELGYKHPAIVDISDVPWLATVQGALVSSLQANGATYTDIESVSATQYDYSTVVRSLEYGGNGGGSGCSTTFYGKDDSGKPVCPDSLIPALDPGSYTRLFSAMDSAGWHPPIIGFGLDKGIFQQQYGDQLGDSTYNTHTQSLVQFLTPYDNQSNSTVQDYLNTVNKYFPNQVQNLDIYTQIAWTASMVFVDAARAAGQNLTRQSLVTALNGIQNFDTGWSTTISYSPGNSHDPNQCVTYVQHDAQPAPQGTWHTDHTNALWHCFPNGSYRPAQ